MDPALFKDKVYLVTGGASGIGLACVQHLLKYGAYVYAVDLGQEPSDELRAIQTDRLTYFRNDVADRKRCHEVMKSLMAKYGRLDGLVNNAGVTLLEGELPGDDLYNAITDCNLRGVWNMSTEALAIMREQKSGSIVNVGSISALVGKARLAVYAASKHAVLGLTRSWALDYAKYGVRINMIGPGNLSSSIGKTSGNLLGATDTIMARTPLKTVMGPLYGMDKTDDELLEHVVQNIPMKRIGTPDDMANSVSFLLSDLSSYVTGQILCVAGGMV